MKNFPKISVVTPSYNQAAYLEATLRSVLDQGYPNLEYIVMDGGSTDGSAEIIARHSSSLAHWQSKADGGQSSAINAGFSRATGDIFCWINSDDLLAPGALFEVAERLAGGSGWLIGASQLIDAHGGMLEVRRPSTVAAPEVLNWGAHWFAQQSTFWTADLWKKAGPLDPKLDYCMDFDLWMRFIALCQPLISENLLSSYRFHEAAKCSDQHSPMFRELCRVSDRHSIAMKIPATQRIALMLQLSSHLLMRANHEYWVGSKKEAVLNTLSAIRMQISIVHQRHPH